MIFFFFFSLIFLLHFSYDFRYQFNEILFFALYLKIFFFSFLYLLCILRLYPCFHIYRSIQNLLVFLLLMFVCNTYSVYAIEASTQNSRNSHLVFLLNPSVYISIVLFCFSCALDVCNSNYAQISQKCAK